MHNDSRFRILFDVSDGMYHGKFRIPLGHWFSIHLDRLACLLVLAGGMDNPMTNATEDAEKSRNAVWDRIAIGSAIVITGCNDLFRRCILPELLLVFEGPIVVGMNLDLWSLLTRFLLCRRSEYLSAKKRIYDSICACDGHPFSVMRNCKCRLKNIDANGFVIGGTVPVSVPSQISIQPVCGSKNWGLACDTSKQTCMRGPFLTNVFCTFFWEMSPNSRVTDERAHAGMQLNGIRNLKMKRFGNAETTIWPRPGQTTWNPRLRAPFSIIDVRISHDGWVKGHKRIFSLFSIANKQDIETTSWFRGIPKLSLQKKKER